MSAVFRVDIKLLREEITVIDKTTEAWSIVPFWVRSGIWGIKTRKMAFNCEVICASIGAIGTISCLLTLDLVILNVFWGSAYWFATAIRWLDNHHMW